MKKTLLLGVVFLSACSNNDQEPNAYYDDVRSQVVIENCDEYTVKMSWLDKTTFVGLDVCLMPENKEIYLEPSHTVEDL